MPSSAKEFGGEHQFRGAGLALAATIQSQGTPVCFGVCVRVSPVRTSGRPLGLC